MMRFEAHLQDCPECASDNARLSAASAAIRAHATRHAAPDDLRAALMQSLGAPGTLNVVPINKFRRWLPPATTGFAVGAVLAASLAIMIDTRNSDDQVADSITAAHIRALQPGHLTDVQISDQHQVKPWFNGRIDFAPPVKEMRDQGFELVGGRLDYLQGHEAAVVVYKRKLHLIDLFVTRATPGARPGSASGGASSGYNVERWTDGGLDYAAVSDLNRDELMEFAKAWRGR